MEKNVLINKGARGAEVLANKGFKGAEAPLVEPFFDGIRKDNARLIFGILLIIPSTIFNIILIFLFLYFYDIIFYKIELRINTNNYEYTLFNNANYRSDT